MLWQSAEVGGGTTLDMGFLERTGREYCTRFWILVSPSKVEEGKWYENGGKKITTLPKRSNIPLSHLSTHLGVVARTTAPAKAKANEIKSLRQQQHDAAAFRRANPEARRSDAIPKPNPER